MKQKRAPIQDALSDDDNTQETPLRTLSPGPRRRVHAGPTLGTGPQKRPVTLELHGDARVDDYYWLRERENPDVIAYLEAEDAYTEEMLEPFMGLQDVLYDEMKARLRQDEESAP
jgi:hypothetical protein